MRVLRSINTFSIWCTMGFSVASLSAQNTATPTQVATVTFQVIDDTGAMIEDCYVNKVVDDHQTDVTSHFQGLKGASVPYGTYRYELKQRNGSPNGFVRGRAAMVYSPEVLVVVTASRSELLGGAADRAVPNTFCDARQT